MKSVIDKYVSGKTVGILGFGREGKSTLPWIINSNKATKIAIIDKNPITLPEDIKNKGVDIELISGDDYQKYLDEFDVIFKSPGVELEKQKDEYSCTILSEMDIFFERYRDQIVGITGTKGKSTTTTLMYNVLKQAGKKVLLAGNIGIPVFDIANDVEEDTIIVLELSCHQLEFATVSPKIAALLNIHEEHLDHYKTMERYTAAKENIYKNQIEGDILFCNQSIAPAEASSKVYSVSGKDICGNTRANIYVEDGIIYTDHESYSIPKDDIALVGNHNYYDIAFVYGISRMLGLDNGQITEGLKTYAPLPHRLEKVGVVDSVAYFDDSISTIDEATIQALNTLTNADTVIIGGMDRGISYDKLESYLSESTVSHIILMEATGKRIYEEIRTNYPMFKNIDRIIVVNHLEDAVRVAKEVTAKGRACVMSPAAASYGIFKNFEERGDAFKKLVLGK